MKINGKIAFASALFVGAIFVLGIKLLTPITIQISIVGSDTVIKPDILVFSLADVILIAISALVLGISGMYLLSFDSVSVSSKGAGGTKERKEWEHTMKTLKGDEKIIYEIIFSENGIIYQSELVSKTNFPKAKVTRCLDALENRGLVERKRKGMGNIVLLK